MSTKFIGMFGINPVFVDFLNMGTAEIILLLIVVFFFLAFLGGFIFLVYFLIRRRESKQQIGNPSSIAINMGFTAPIRPQADGNELDQISKSHAVLNEKIALPQQHEIRYVLVTNIIRCEADDNYTNFYLMGGEKVLISKSLKEYADLLAPNGFLRTHQSHLVNPTFVKSWLKEDGGVLLMTNGDKIPVSKPNRESVRELLSR